METWSFTLYIPLLLTLSTCRSTTQSSLNSIEPWWVVISPTRIWDARLLSIQVIRIANKWLELDSHVKSIKASTMKKMQKMQKWFSNRSKAKSPMGRERNCSTIWSAGLAASLKREQQAKTETYWEQMVLKFDAVIDDRSSDDRKSHLRFLNLTVRSTSWSWIRLVAQGWRIRLALFSWNLHSLSVASFSTATVLLW